MKGSDTRCLGKLKKRVERERERATRRGKRKTSTGDSHQPRPGKIASNRAYLRLRLLAGDAGRRAARQQAADRYPVKNERL